MNQLSPIFQRWQESDITIQKMFRSIASFKPEALALTEPGISLTYSELDKLSDSLSIYLQANGVSQGKIVGVYLEKCHEYIVACLAILKAGAAYLHLDLAYSKEVLKKILAETNPVVIISKNNHLAGLPGDQIKTVMVDEKTGWNRYGKKWEGDISMSADETAFIGYSSGTTGIPKGIRVSHRAAIYSLSKFWEEIWQLHDIMDFGYATYLSWDAMSPLLFGATGHIIPDAIDNNAMALVGYIKENKINHIFFTPSLLKVLLQEVPTETLKSSLDSLKVIWVGGEVTTGELVEGIYKILPQVRLVNNYGPSECFVVAQGQLTKDDASLPLCPVGRVLPEMEILILDQKMKETTNGLPGELYVSGPCLSDGYLNNPKLTQDKFIEIRDNKYYKTGDLASFLPDGRLMIHGRADFFINIDGKQVNSLEIQYNIKKALPLADCVVVGEEDPAGNKYFVCYYVRASVADWQADPEKIKEILSAILPREFIPRRYQELSRIPISSTSQKVNYKQLNKTD